MPPLSERAGDPGQQLLGILQSTTHRSSVAYNIATWEYMHIIILMHYSESQSGQQSRPVRGEVLNEATELQAPGMISHIATYISVYGIILMHCSGSQNGQQSRPEHGEVLNEATELQALGMISHTATYTPRCIYGIIIIHVLFRVSEWTAK